MRQNSAPTKVVSGSHDWARGGPGSADRLISQAWGLTFFGELSEREHSYDSALPGQVELEYGEMGKRRA